MKHAIILAYHRAVRDGLNNYAASLAALYRKEYGGAIPSEAVEAVRHYLASKPTSPNDRFPSIE